MNNSQIVESVTVSGFGGLPAWWNNTTYYGGSSESGSDYLKAFAFSPSAGQFSTSYSSESPTFFNYPGPTPVISSNGASNGVVWALQKGSIYVESPGNFARLRPD